MSIKKLVKNIIVTKKIIVMKYSWIAVQFFQMLAYIHSEK